MNSKYDKGAAKRIKICAIFCGIACFIIGMMLGNETIRISDANKELISIKQDYASYIEAAGLLQQGSDILTEDARRFVVTGEKASLLAYFKEYNIDGHREQALSIINKLGLEEISDSKLQVAMRHSNELMQVEYRAMTLVALANGMDFDELPDEIAFFELTPYENGLLAEAQREMGRELLFNNAYESAKDGIKNELNEFLEQVLASSAQKNEKISTQLVLAVRYQRVLTVAFLLLLGITIAFILELGRLDNRQKEELIKINEQLSTKKSELLEANKEVQIANEAKSEFLSKMSYEMRTPINAIIVATEQAKRHTEEPVLIVEGLDKIESDSKHLLALINNVLDLGRIESGMVEIRSNPLNLNTFVDSCTKIMSRTLGVAGLTYIKDISVLEHPNVLGDELHLRQVMLNLMENSVKLTPEGGRVLFRVYEEDWDENTVCCKFEIEDNGIGMSEQYLARIFDSFVTEQESYSHEYSGLGVGLNLAKQYIDLMGGTVNVESTLKKGSKFTVTIPFSRYTRTTLTDSGNDNRRLSGIRILVAEDNVVNLEMAREILEKEGAEVSVAENGEIALGIFRSASENYFDAILMDITMPIMDGLTATREIRELPRQDARNIPIIAMTADSTAEDIEQERKAGLNAHVNKPVEISVLVKTILDCVRQKSSDLQEQLEKALRDANTDALTGVKNRNAFELMTGNLDISIKNGDDIAFAIVLCDVNGLKYINDNIGHEDGDRLLINSCRTICKIFAHSPVFRIGGDEFVAVLRNDDYYNRDELMAGIYSTMTAENYSKVSADNISFAAGIAVYDKNTDRDCSDVFKRADGQMYIHKKSIKGDEEIR